MLGNSLKSDDRRERKKDKDLEGIRGLVVAPGVDISNLKLTD